MEHISLVENMDNSLDMIIVKLKENEIMGKGTINQLTTTMNQQGILVVLTFLSEI